MYNYTDICLLQIFHILYTFWQFFDILFLATSMQQYWRVQCKYHFGETEKNVFTDFTPDFTPKM